MPPAVLFGLPQQLELWSVYDESLEKLAQIIVFEAFRPILSATLAYGVGHKGGSLRPDAVSMLKVLSGAAELRGRGADDLLIRDRLSWLRYWGR